LGQFDITDFLSTKERRGPCEELYGLDTGDFHVGREGEGVKTEKFGKSQMGPPKGIKVSIPTGGDFCEIHNWRRAGGAPGGGKRRQKRGH